LTVFSTGNTSPQFESREVSIGCSTPASRQRWMRALQGWATSAKKPARNFWNASSSSLKIGRFGLAPYFFT
jgi:hypothetical protein